MPQDKNNQNLALALAIPLVIVGAFFYLIISKQTTPSQPAEASAPPTAMDIFAQCLKDSGAKFYGASWCSHCQNQKKLFSNSKNLPYIECAEADSNGQAQICADAKIKGYPTWIFADGSSQSGELSFEILSQKTGCQLPQ